MKAESPDPDTGLTPISRDYCMIAADRLPNGKACFKYVLKTGDTKQQGVLQEDERLNGLLAAITDTLRILDEEKGESDKNLGKDKIKPDLVSNTLSYLIDHYKEKDVRLTVAEAIHYNPRYLSEVVYKRTGIRLRDYIHLLRLMDAERLLLTTGLTIQEIADRVGYSSASGFKKAYRRFNGQAPCAVRKEAAKKKP